MNKSPDSTSTPRRLGAGLHDTLVWITLIVICVGVIYFAWQRDQRSDGSDSILIPTSVGVQAPLFTMTDQSGAEFSSEQLKGRVWVADFIFTNCAGPCPIMTQRMSDLQEQIGPRDDIAYVSFTCDPDRDTPEALHEYGEKYGADFSTWSFLTGPYENIQKVAKGFLLSVQRPYEEAARMRLSEEIGEVPGTGDYGDDSQQAHGGDVIHSTRFVLVNRDGEIVGWYESTDINNLARLRADLVALLSNG